MAKGKVVKLDIPIYGGTIYFTECRKKFNSVCRKMGAFEVDKATVGSAIQAEEPDGGAGYLIGVFDGDDSTLVHEVAHVSFMILTRADIDPRDSRNEVFCYLIGWLFGEIKKLQPQLSADV